jgi:hypothetical protein
MITADVDRASAACHVLGVKARPRNVGRLRRALTPPRGSGSLSAMVFVDRLGLPPAAQRPRL